MNHVNLRTNAGTPGMENATKEFPARTDGLTTSSISRQE